MPGAFKKKTRGAPGSATQTGKPPKTGGNGSVTQHDGRKNDKGGANYQSGGKRDFGERVYKYER